MTTEDTELIDKLQAASLCQLGDSLGPSWGIDTSIRPLDPVFRICGPAVTALCEPGENLTIHQALHLARPGDVLVASGSSDCGLWGELMSTSAKVRGLRGTIIDGSVRDPQEIRAMGYPVFSRCTNPRTARKDRYGKVNIPIRCGSLLVNPGDIIFADVNGMLSFPANRLSEVLRMVLEVIHKEEEIMKQVQQGRTIVEILGLAH